MRKQHVYMASDANWAEQEGAVSERFQDEPYGQVAAAEEADVGSGADGLAWHCLHQGLAGDGDTSALHRFRNRDHSPSLGRCVQQNPMGYVDGMSLYEYVRSAPIVACDPAGLYTITWDPASNWTAGEMSAIQDSLDRVLVKSSIAWANAERLLRQIKNYDPPFDRCVDYSLDTKELMTLQQILMKMVNGLSLTKEKLTFRKRDWGNRDASARWVKNWGTHYVEFNPNAAKPWSGFSNDKLDVVPMHELSHEYGTEDDDSLGKLINAHVLEQLATFDESKDFLNWTPVRFLILQAEKAGGK